MMARREVLIPFSGAMLGLLLAALDQTIVATALPRIVADLHGLNHLSWVVTAYLLTSTVTVPLYGKLSISTAASACSWSRSACSCSARPCAAPRSR